MTTNRMEAFSDGVIAIAITIMVLEMKVPHDASWNALAAIWPVLLSYVMSFIYLGIYWNNHHHMMHITQRVNGPVLWANLHLLFWLSLIPFTTGWMGENGFAAAPTAAYGAVLFMAAIAYYLLQWAIMSGEGCESQLRAALGADLKGKSSIALYALAVALSFVSPLASNLIFAGTALMWLVPDTRIERRLREEE